MKSAKIQRCSKLSEGDKGNTIHSSYCFLHSIPECFTGAIHTSIQFRAFNDVIDG